MSIVSPVGDSHWPWGVAVPGLTAEGAQFIADTVTGQQPDVQVIQIDPKDFLLLHMDRATVVHVIEALDPESDSPIASGFRETLQDWLEFVGPE